MASFFIASPQCMGGRVTGATSGSGHLDSEIEWEVQE